MKSFKEWINGTPSTPELDALMQNLDQAIDSLETSSNNPINKAIINIDKMNQYLVDRVKPPIESIDDRETSSMFRASVESIHSANQVLRLMKDRAIKAIKEKKKAVNRQKKELEGDGS